MSGHSTIANLLRKRAGWFVLAAWLLLVLAILAATEVGIPKAVNAFYYPQHEWVDYDRALNRLILVGAGVGLVVALASSLMLAMGWRVAAAAFVTLGWLGLVTGGALHLRHVERAPQRVTHHPEKSDCRRAVGYAPAVVPTASANPPYRTYDGPPARPASA